MFEQVFYWYKDLKGLFFGGDGEHLKTYKLQDKEVFSRVVNSVKN